MQVDSNFAEGMGYTSTVVNFALVLRSDYGG